MSCNIPYTTVNLVKARGDTRYHIFRITDKDDNVIDISGWTNFRLAVDPSKTPVDDSNNVDLMTGILATDGLDGRVAFRPSGTVDPGNYFYDAEGLDETGGKVTFAGGKYKIIQDITKA